MAIAAPESMRPAPTEVGPVQVESAAVIVPPRGLRTSPTDDLAVVPAVPAAASADIPAPPTRAEQRRSSDGGGSVADTAPALPAALRPATATTAVGGAPPSSARVEDDLRVVEPPRAVARPAPMDGAQSNPARAEDDLRAVEPAPPAARPAKQIPVAAARLATARAPAGERASGDVETEPRWLSAPDRPRTIVAPPLVQKVADPGRGSIAHSEPSTILGERSVPAVAHVAVPPQAIIVRAVEPARPAARRAEEIRASTARPAARPATAPAAGRERAPENAESEPTWARGTERPRAIPAPPLTKLRAGPGSGPAPLGDRSLSAVRRVGVPGQPALQPSRVGAFAPASSVSRPGPPPALPLRTRQDHAPATAAARKGAVSAPNTPRSLTPAATEPVRPPEAPVRPQTTGRFPPTASSATRSAPSPESTLSIGRIDVTVVNQPAPPVGRHPKTSEGTPGRDIVFHQDAFLARRGLAWFRFKG